MCAICALPHSSENGYYPIKWASPNRFWKSAISRRSSLFSCSGMPPGCIPARTHEPSMCSPRVYVPIPICGYIIRSFGCEHHELWMCSSCAVYKITTSCVRAHQELRMRSSSEVCGSINIGTRGLNQLYLRRAATSRENKRS